MENAILGLFLGLVGAGAIAEGLSLPVGSAMRMGPGYFPILIGGVLVVLGLAITLLPTRHVAAAWERADLARGAVDVLAVILAVTSFGFLVERLGLIASIVVAVFISTAPIPAMSLLERFVLAICLAVGSYLIFVYALGVSMPGFTFNW
ncbi:tripartite tricarboxylate transporter TctB family protein [Geminicoccaceae bacterium 1502E]|nr:tripartite tricarboxylate transporter TctB family protein [Geminicoccaceae bacterium 1502E]